jgi:hypothetical protein
LNCLPTDLFLSLGRKRTSIFCSHTRNIQTILLLCKLYYALISNSQINYNKKGVMSWTHYSVKCSKQVLPPISWM